MNATVTRPATKDAGKKVPAGAAAPANAKSARKSIAGTGANPVAAPLAGKLDPTPAKSVKKIVAKTARTTVKSSTGAAAKTPSKPVGKTAPGKPAVPAATRAGSANSITPKAAKATTALKPTADRRASEARSKETSGSFMSGNNGSTGFMDTMGKPAVSKVSEVATKTTKPTPDDGTLLTEEQILKMSDKDYMNEAQLAFFKARLQQLEQDLLKNAGETTEHLRETVLVPDPADRATIEEEHALELRTRDRERKLLKKVQQSIASIDTGDYGWCEETGEPIGIPRLLARPTATLSLEAQQRRELKQKMYGD